MTISVTLFSRLDKLSPPTIIVLSAVLVSCASGQTQIQIDADYATPQDDPPAQNYVPASNSCESDALADSAPLPQPPEPESAFYSYADKTHEVVSLGLEGSVKKVDDFFASDNVFQDTTDSYMRFSTAAITDEDGELRYDVELKLKIDLARTKKSLKLLIESAPSDTEQQTLPPANSAVSAAKENDYFVSLERQLKKTGNWDVRPGAGIKVNWLPDLFLRLRATRYITMDPWLLRINGNVFWFATEGFGTNGSLQFDRALAKPFMLRSRTFVERTEEKEYTKAEHIFSLFQHLSDRHNLVYQAGVLADDRSHWQVDSYLLRTIYRRRIHKKWLFLELRPEVFFKQADDFDASYYFTTQLEAVFGQEYIDKQLQRME